MKPEIEKFFHKPHCYRKHGWSYLHIEGSPYERGFQHGYTLAKELAVIIETMRKFSMFYTGKTFEFFAQAAAKLFAPHIDSEFQEEIRGISEGTAAAGFHIPSDVLMAWNGFLELMFYWWPNASSQAKKIQSKNRQCHCSAFIATGNATKDHGIVMAHNTWLDYVLGQYFHVILDIEPADGYRVLMQSAPGYIHSFTDFFITGAGIIGTETTIKGFENYQEGGAPEFFRARKAMQYGRDLDHWVEIMEEQNNGGYANSWLIGDIHSNEIARFELGLEYSDYKKIKDGVFTGFNAPESPQIRNLECSYTGYTDVRDTGARRIRWRELMGNCYGKIDIDTAKRMIADHFDVYLQREDHPSSRTLCGHTDVDPYEFTGITGGEPYNSEGSVDGKVVTSRLAANFSFWARFGRSCGEPFDADGYLLRHPQWDWQRGLLMDRPTQPWTLIVPKK
ncbi:C45 family autoproteolytic acyltransferase/hydolase [Candidatus Formimonas warabiya]|uniref:Phospholipase n=1 Tax=Formimonas warabiya TaxID=1761012 RepID=A0A3G1KQI4_FORW1|nr:C45 family peptidase [Candidatus Formimonas warabiya]ATW24724.1 hypothetical protein DCMF_07995 [Candidatus Formimonas warabiya]